MKIQSISFQAIGNSWLKDRVEEIIPPEADIDPEHLEFIIYNSLEPAVVKFSKQLSEKHLNGTGAEDRGICPVCGQLPAFSLLSRSGARSLVCSFCRYEWKTIRIFCPFCGNKESGTLDYMHIEDEKEIRADLCRACGKYIKTVDLRELAPDIYPPLAFISSVALDIKLQEENSV